MRANIVKNLANSPLLPSVFALLARIVILNLYRLALTEVPLSFRLCSALYAQVRPALMVCFLNSIPCGNLGIYTLQ
jgi:hypothetical protein